MAKTKSEMFALIGANLPDNTTELITPAKVREVLTQTADSMLYAAAGMKEVEVLRAFATTTQQPSALNTPLQVTFGAAQKSITDPVMINSAGLVTFNQAGNYAVRIKLQAGRTALVGVATVNSRILVNGAQVGSPSATRIDSSSMIIPIESRVVVDVAATNTFSVQIMRDGADGSINAGGVFAVTSAVGAWGISPSALLVISRLEPV
jgi:hypothetical protein